MNEIYSFDKQVKAEEKKVRNSKKVNNYDECKKIDVFKIEEKQTMKEYYKNYCEELEKCFEENFQRNENLNMKIVI